jgi:hypothetical protein
MIHSHEPAILDLTLLDLEGAIRRIAVRILGRPEVLDVSHFRRVAGLMRLAIALEGTGAGLPFAEYHGIPPMAGPGALPEILSVRVTDLLAARAADHLPAALEGEPEALRAFEREAEQLLETEDIQLV